MNKFDYEIVFSIGDKVFFNTDYPKSKIQPNYASALSHPKLIEPKKIKGELVGIFGNRFLVLSDSVVYQCERNILKPLVKESSVVFFEMTKKKTSLQKFYEEKEINDIKKDYLLGKINRGLICFVSGLLVCFIIFWILGFVK